MHVLITVVNHFSNGEKFDTELCTRLLTLVDNPMITVVVRMDVRMGQLCNVRMAQARKSAEDEDIPVDTRFIVG